MATKAKKVILFIVEGKTDESALSPILKKIFQSEEVRFHVVYGDMTSDWSVASVNAIKTVQAHINAERQRYGFKKNDIIKVIHLVDTDGAFIQEEKVVLNPMESIRYFYDKIETRTPDRIIDRNKRKTQILKRLSSTPAIDKIPYRIYYFSRNLEHVLHNNFSNLTEDEKINYADDFANRYSSDQAGFIEFVSCSGIAVTGEYKDTWVFITQGTNSLHRHSNFHLLFQKGAQDG